MSRVDAQELVDKSKWLPDPRTEGLIVGGKKINPVDIPGHMEAHRLFDDRRGQSFLREEYLRRSENERIGIFGRLRRGYRNFNQFMRSAFAKSRA